MEVFKVGDCVTWQSTSASPRKTGWVVAAFRPGRPVSLRGLPSRFRAWKMRFRLKESQAPAEHYVIATQGGLLYHPRSSQLVLDRPLAPGESVKELWTWITAEARKSGAVGHGNNKALRRKKASGHGGAR